jgi:hypothetical protein
MKQIIQLVQQMPNGGHRREIKVEVEMDFDQVYPINASVQNQYTEDDCKLVVEGKIGWITFNRIVQTLRNNNQRLDAVVFIRSITDWSLVESANYYDSH